MLYEVITVAVRIVEAGAAVDDHVDGDRGVDGEGVRPLQALDRDRLDTRACVGVGRCRATRGDVDRYAAVDIEPLGDDRHVT